ncbi:hypothetical protein ACT4MK_03160 [Bradyrhizobium barranii]|uniref:hypothetical protein n=1 Tax=Bradyrhizobium TaxID=374 RepID=UPI003F237C75
MLALGIFKSEKIVFAGFFLDCNDPRVSWTHISVHQAQELYDRWTRLIELVGRKGVAPARRSAPG